MNKWIFGLLIIVGVAVIVVAATVMSGDPTTGFTWGFGGKF